MSLLNSHELNWDSIFWVLYVVTGVAIIVAASLQIMPTEYLLGLVIVIIGIERLGVEFAHRKMLEKQSELSENLFYVSKGLEENFNVAADSKQKNDYRAYQLDKKRIKTEKDLNSKYRDAVTKILELENKINKVSKNVEKMKTKK
jgi:hypothetical protein